MNQSRLVPPKVPTSHLLSPNLLSVCWPDFLSHQSYLWSPASCERAPGFKCAPQQRVSFCVNVIDWYLATRLKNHAKPWEYPLLTPSLLEPQHVKDRTSASPEQVSRCVVLFVSTMVPANTIVSPELDVRVSAHPAQSLSVKACNSNGSARSKPSANLLNVHNFSSLEDIELYRANIFKFWNRSA